LARTTLHDVARTAGVSLATVDRVLNRRPGVHAETAERVHEAIGQLKYRPDRLAAMRIGDGALRRRLSGSDSAGGRCGQEPYRNDSG